MVAASFRFTWHSMVTRSAAEAITRDDCQYSVLAGEDGAGPCNAIPQRRGETERTNEADSLRIGC
jgi:hypothetical protein